MNSTNEKILSLCRGLFRDNKIEIIGRLSGGMSNETYIIKVEDEKYTIRIPGKKASKFVSREIENENILLFSDFDFSQETIFT